MSKKGMSQTLALIVAASVLMMTALTVIFLAQGSLGEFGQTTGRQACTSAVQSKCAATGSTQIDTPGPCYASEGDLRNDLPSYISGDTIQCANLP